MGTAAQKMPELSDTVACPDVEMFPFTQKTGLTGVGEVADAVLIRRLKGLGGEEIIILSLGALNGEVKI